MNEFSDWKIATGLEHTVRYLKPVKPDVNYQVTGVVNFEEIWKNPKYTHLKMENILKSEKDCLVEDVLIKEGSSVSTDEVLITFK